MWPEKQKEGLLALFVANIDLLVCLLTLGDWQAGSDQRGLVPTTLQLVAEKAAQREIHNEQVV